MKFLLIFIFVVCMAFGDSYYMQGGNKIYLNVLNSTQTIDYYKDNNGAIVGINSGIILKVINDNDINILANEYNLIVNKRLGDNIYLVSVSDKSMTLDVSNRLSNDIRVEYAQPDFIKKRVAR